MKEIAERKDICAKKLNKITKLIEIGEITPALKKITKLYKLNPTNHIVKLKFAEILIRANKNREKARKYFNELLSTNTSSFAILNLGNLEFSYGNIDEAIKYFNQLSNKKTSNSSSLQLGRIDALEGNYTNAKKLFEDALNPENDKFLDESLIKLRAIYELLQLNISYEKYEEALFYLDKLIDMVGVTGETLKISFYLKYKLGILDNVNIYSYFNSQVLNYNRNDAIEHIKSHHSEFNLPIEDLFEIIENNIDILKKSDYGVCDKYLLNLGLNVGKSNNIETTVIKIVTICNTYDILTMYPTIDYCNVFPKEKVKIK